MKVRCPVCNGTGGVEPSFGMGGCGFGGTSTIASKPCPGCGGTGIQEEAVRFGEYGVPLTTI